MRQMTEEEAKRLRKGDTVLIIGTVLQNDGTDQLPVEVEVEGLDNFWPYPRTIHSATPPPLEVGDRVNVDRCAWNPGNILAIDDGEAWVLWDSGVRATMLLSGLERVDD